MVCSSKDTSKVSSASDQSEFELLKFEKDEGRSRTILLLEPNRKKSLTAAKCGCCCILIVNNDKKKIDVS